MARRASRGMARTAALSTYLLLQINWAFAARVERHVDGNVHDNSAQAREAAHIHEVADVAHGTGRGMYAFIVKYRMEKMYGFEIAHTSLVVAPRDAVKHEVAKFEKWCGSKWGSCFKESGWGIPQPMPLPDTAIEYEFFEDGIKELKYGESTFKDSPAIQVFPVGPVTKKAVAEALETSKACGRSSAGYLLDYNSKSNHVIEHNSHTFVDLLLRLLKLPYWKAGSGLPSGFMPENKDRNPVSGRLVAKLLGGNLPPFTASRTCGGTCCDGEASGGIDLGFDFGNITF